MKLSAYQEGLLKNISSVQRRRDVRNDMKSLYKEIDRTEWIMEECKGGSTRNLPAWGLWEQQIENKRKRIKEIENSLKEKN